MDENGKLIAREYPFEKTWESMEKVHESGKARAIGVSNFSIKTLVESLPRQITSLMAFAPQIRWIAQDCSGSSRW